MPDTNPVYGGPYLDQHVPDVDVPNSFPSGNTNMPIINTDTANVPAADQSGVGATATAESTVATADSSSVSDNPDSTSPTFTPQTDTTEHL